jgi:hypothetical protein
MLFPMMGLLFMLVIGGVAAGIFFLLVRPLRVWAPFIAFPPIAAGLLAFSLSWGLSLSVEQFLHSERWAGICFIGGYALGGLSGFAAGLLLAVKIRRRGA